MLNPGYVFLLYVTEAFLLFLAPAGGPNPAGPIFKPCGTIINSLLTYPNLSKATVKIQRNPALGFIALVSINVIKFRGGILCSTSIMRDCAIFIKVNKNSMITLKQ